jgi:hypothetical protein
VQRRGLVRERRNAAVLFTAGISRLLDRPLNIIVKGHSSAGKNHLVRCALRPFPRDAIRELTSSSALAWNYAGDDFQRRIVYLQELNEASGVVHPSRLLISEGCLVRIVTVNEGGVRTAKRFVTKGPIASISTTTKNQLQIDDETRNVSIWVDESNEQTREITRANSIEQSAPDPRELRVWREAHRLLEDRASVCRIILPSWFVKVADYVYDADIRVRRYFPAFATGCKAIALLRSFVRVGVRTKPPKTLEVQFADFAITAIVFDKVFVESLHSARDKATETRTIVERISKRKNSQPVDAMELAKELGISKDSAYERMRRAEIAGTIERVNKPEKGNRKLFLPTPRPRFIPDPEELFQKIPELGNEAKFCPSTDWKVSDLSTQRSRHCQIEGFKKAPHGKAFDCKGTGGQIACSAGLDIPLAQRGPPTLHSVQFPMCSVQRNQTSQSWSMILAMGQ